MIAIMIAGAVATFVSLFGTRALMGFFRTRGRGQPILGKEDHGPEHHMHKQGTPTMGGVAIVGAALTGWLAAHIRRGLPFSDQAMIVWVAVLAMAFMGFLDDYIKVKKRHNRGIFWKRKNYVTMLMSFGAAWWLVAATGISETISLTRAEDLGFAVPKVVWIIWAGLIIGPRPAVNVTTGSTAGGRIGAGFGAFTIIAYWASAPSDHTESSPRSTGVIAAPSPAPSLGFLWWNAAPARIIMGDVGASRWLDDAFLALTLAPTFAVVICGTM